MARSGVGGEKGWWAVDEVRRGRVCNDTCAIAGGKVGRVCCDGGIWGMSGRTHLLQSLLRYLSLLWLLATETSSRGGVKIVGAPHRRSGASRGRTQGNCAGGARTEVAQTYRCNRISSPSLSNSAASVLRDVWAMRRVYGVWEKGRGKARQGAEQNGRLHRQPQRSAI